MTLTGSYFQLTGTKLILTVVAALMGQAGVSFAAKETMALPSGATSMSPNAIKIDIDPSLFRSDPDYRNTSYDPEVEKLLYAKWEVPNTRPALEVGRQLFRSGGFERASELFGSSNLTYLGSDLSVFGHEFNGLRGKEEGKGARLPQTMIYGDFRTAMGFTDKGNGDRQATLATKFDLDFDMRFTSTERIHAFFTPLNNGGDITRWDIGGKVHNKVSVIGNAEPATWFFEGDLARIIGGSGNSTFLRNHDIPFAIGRIPLFFQNGTWFNDAVTGFAVTIPARNSPALDISNMDITFFGGFDHVTTGAIPEGESNANIYGVAGFVDTLRGYIEFGYGYTQGKNGFEDRSYHNATISFTKRYFDTISNSIRVIANFGQNPDSRDNGGKKTADGFLFILENSLITKHPLTCVPYLNAFAGVGTPQSLARDAGAGGVLLNEGILFEGDNLIAAFPKLDASANKTLGYALGVNLLSGPDYTPSDVHRTDYASNRKKNQQLVVEVGSVFTTNSGNNIMNQHGIGVRYQKAISANWLVRADAIYELISDHPNAFGAKLEIRRKF